MSGESKKTLKINCMSDLEKVFYPKLFKEKSVEAIDNPRILGAKLAQRSLKRIRYQLARVD